MIAFVLLIGKVQVHAQDPNSGQRRVASEVTVANSIMMKKVKNVDALKFVYSGEANFFTKKFIDLSKKLQKAYRDTYKIAFQYNMVADNKPVRVYENYPANTNKEIDHDLIFRIRAYDYEVRRLAVYINEKYTYKVSIEIIESKTNELVESIQLDVESINTLSDNNDGIIKILNTVIMNRITSN